MSTVNNGYNISSFMTETIKFVCETFRKRTPGTKSERTGQEYFAKLLRECADEIKVERFALHPAAFGSALTISGILCLLSTVFVIFAAAFGTVRFSGVISFIFLLVSFLLTAAEFIFCRPIFDFLFPRRISKNVYAVIKPSEEVKRRIIFSAHIDAPGELLLSSRSLKKYNFPLLAAFIAGVLICFILSAVYLFIGCPAVKGGWIAYLVVLCLFSPFFLFAVFYRKPGKTVDGACSSLTGCAVAVSVLKSLHESEGRFEDTEVACLITGGHNAGCRGAAAFVRAHKKELRRVPTYVIPIGSVSAGGRFTVCSTDCCGTVKNSMDCAQLLIAAGRETGTDIAHADYTFRCTDAAAFTAGGISACTLEAGETENRSPACTKADTWRCVSSSTADAVLDICLAGMRKFAAAPDAEIGEK